MTFANGQQQKHQRSDSTWPRSPTSCSDRNRLNPASNFGSRHRAYGSAYRPVLQPSNDTQQLHERMLFLLANLTGSIVQVTARDGVKFEGVLHGASTEGELGVALVQARKIHDPSVQACSSETGHCRPPIAVLPSVLISGKDLVDIDCPETDLTAGVPRTGKNSFRTDTDISNGRRCRTEIRERQLHKWNPDTDSDFLGPLEDTSLTSDNTTKPWDQFAANERLFGIKTDFDEEIYTTPLDRNAPGYRDRERRAIDMANEIRESAAISTHVLEERGLALDESVMDEEDRYGAVVRQHDPDAHISLTSSKQVNNRYNNNHITTPPCPITNLADARPKANNKAKDERIEQQVAKSFRRFARREKGRLFAKKQALQSKNKEERLADLLQFHRTFKLNLPIPPDLEPLLSKTNKPEGGAAVVADRKSAGAAQKMDLHHDVKDMSLRQHDEARHRNISTLAAEGDPNSNDKCSAYHIFNTKRPKRPFRFNVKATEFKPDPTIQEFLLRTKAGSVRGAPRFVESDVSTKRVNVTITGAFKSPFIDGKSTIRPRDVAPTWAIGTKQYRMQFAIPSPDDACTFIPSPPYSASYSYTQYRYPPYYVPVTASVSGNRGYPPAYQLGQHNVPLVAIPVPPPGGRTPPAEGYSPQMGNVSPYIPQFPYDVPSPQQSPQHNLFVPWKVYQYQANASHGSSPALQMAYAFEGGVQAHRRPVPTPTMIWSSSDFARCPPYPVADYHNSPAGLRGQPAYRTT